MNRMRNPRLAFLLTLVYLGIAGMLTALHGVEINFGDHGKQRGIRHERVLAGTGEAPWTYRVLMPAVAEAVAVPLRALMSDPAAREFSYLVWRFLGIAAFLLLFHVYLRRWLELPWAIAGVLWAAALHPASFQFYWFQPDSPTDLAVWTAAAVLTFAGRDRWLFPLIFVGSLNRETAVFVIAVHAALRWGTEPSRKLVLRCLLLGVCWAVPFVGIRLMVGQRAWVAPIAELAADNLNAGWLAWALVCLGALLIVPFARWSHSPPELRRLAIALITTYLPLQLVFGRIREVRLLLPLVLALIPLALLAVRDAHARGDGPDSPRSETRSPKPEARSQ